jgi:hypothetical protein
MTRDEAVGVVVVMVVRRVQEEGGSAELLFPGLGRKGALDTSIYIPGINVRTTRAHTRAHTSTAAGFHS